MSYAEIISSISEVFCFLYEIIAIAENNYHRVNMNLDERRVFLDGAERRKEMYS